MKKILCFSIVFMTLLLVACSNTNDSNNSSSKETTNSSTSEVTTSDAIEFFAEDAETNSSGWVIYGIPMTTLSEEENMKNEDIARVVDYAKDDRYTAVSFMAYNPEKNTYVYSAKDKTTDAMIAMYVEELEDGTLNVYSSDYNDFSTILGD